MEFAIPISRFDPTKVRWGQARSGPFRKTISFNYEDSQLAFQSLNLMSDPLTVVYFDTDKNQLVLEETPQGQFLIKIDQFQTLINGQIKRHYKDWLEGTNLPESEVIAPLQPWLKSQKITLYLSNEPSSIPFFTKNGSEIISDKTLKPGDLIRAMVRLQGVSLQLNELNDWTGKSRIQHYVIELYRISE
jgi:hypothetical protein